MPSIQAGGGVERTAALPIFFNVKSLRGEMAGALALLAVITSHCSDRVRNIFVLSGALAHGRDSTGTYAELKTMLSSRPSDRWVRPKAAAKPTVPSSEGGREAGDGVVDDARE